MTIVCRFSIEEQATVKYSSLFQLRTDFCRRAEHFCYGRWAPPQVWCFRNSDMQTDLSIRRSVTPVKSVFFSRRSTLIRHSTSPKTLILN